MGWNCTIVTVRDTDLAHLAVLEPLLWTATDTTVSWDEATSSAFDGVAAWERGDDLVLASGGLHLIDAVPALGALGAAYGGLFQSVTDTYFWETAGDAGRRSWRWSSYEPVVDEGPPHPAEAGVEQLDEDALFDLLAAGGLVYDAALEEAELLVLATGVPEAEPPPRRRKRFGLF